VFHHDEKQACGPAFLWPDDNQVGKVAVFVYKLP
jgi:hypothetical protein